MNAFGLPVTDDPMRREVRPSSVVDAVMVAAFPLSIASDTTTITDDLSRIAGSAMSR